MDAGRRGTGAQELHHVFLMTGASPNTRWLAGCVALDDHGFVKTGPDLTPRTSHTGAGRGRPTCSRRAYLECLPQAMCVLGSVKRIASAVGEGSITVQFVHRALRDLLAAAAPHAIAAA